MDCKDFFEWLDNYESIDEVQRESLEFHTQSCEACRKEWEFFKSIIETSATIPCPKPPETFIADINKRLDNEPVLTGFAKLKYSVKANSRSIATLAACLAVGITVGINSGYIKGRLQDNSTEGIIKETEHSDIRDSEIDDSTSETGGAEIAETEMAENSSSIEKPTVQSKENKTGADKVAESGTQKQRNAKDNIVTAAENNAKATVTPSARSRREVEHNAAEKPSEPPKSTVKPTATSEPIGNVAETAGSEQPTVDDYAISDNNNQVAYQSESEPEHRAVATTLSDYLIVGSGDVSVVESAMNDLGVKNADGYYMTSRSNFYQLMNRLSREDIKYSCDLKYSSGERIAFKLIGD